MLRDNSYVTSDHGPYAAPTFSMADAPKDALVVNISSQVTVSPLFSPEVAAEFKRHERKWKRDTRYTSSLSEKYLHPSYARIIGLGRPALPHILRSLEKEPDDWFYALRAITGSNVVPMSMAGDMKRMADRWIEWGRKRGLA